MNERRLKKKEYLNGIEKRIKSLLEIIFEKQVGKR